MINKTLGVNLQYSSKPPSKKFVWSYFLININEAGPWTGSAMVFNLKPAFFEIYKILLDTDKQKSWHEFTVQ